MELHKPCVYVIYVYRDGNAGREARELQERIEGDYRVYIDDGSADASSVPGYTVLASPQMLLPLRSR